MLIILALLGLARLRKVPFAHTFTASLFFSVGIMVFSTNVGTGGRFTMAIMPTAILLGGLFLSQQLKSPRSESSGVGTPEEVP